MGRSKSKESGALSAYFASIWNGLLTTVTGLGVTGRYLLRKPVTLQYPTEPARVAEGFRGIHVFEKDKCIACDLCAVACPVDCIYIESIGKGKNAQITRYEIDYNRCMFCALCVEPCPVDCIHMGKSFDLAQFDSPSCSIEFASLWDEKGLQSPTGDTMTWLESDPGRR